MTRRPFRSGNAAVPRYFQAALKVHTEPCHCSFRICAHPVSRSQTNPDQKRRICLIPLPTTFSARLQIAKTSHNRPCFLFPGISSARKIDFLQAPAVSTSRSIFASPVSQVLLTSPPGLHTLPHFLRLPSSTLLCRWRQLHPLGRNQLKTETILQDRSQCLSPVWFRTSLSAMVALVDRPHPLPSPRSMTELHTFLEPCRTLAPLLLA